MDLPEKKQTNNKTNFIVFMLLFIVVIAMAGYAYTKSNNIDIRSFGLGSIKDSIFLGDAKDAAKSTSEFTYNFKENVAFSAYKDYIIQCSADGIKWLDKTGTTVSAFQAPLVRPVIKKSGDMLMVGDVGGKDLYVIEGKTVKWDKKTEGEIINIDINENGYASVVQEGKGYKAVVNVYNPQGMEYFSRAVAENFVLDARVSPSNKQVVLERIDTSGINAGSSIEFNNIDAEKPFANIKVEEAIIASLKFLNDGALFISGDDMVKYLDKNRNEKWKKQYEDLLCTGLLLGKYPVIVSEKEGKKILAGSSGSEVSILNLKGEKIAEYSVDDTVIEMETIGDIIALNTGKHVFFINSRGKLVAKFNSKFEVSQIGFFNKNEAMIVTKSSVAVVKI